MPREVPVTHRAKPASRKHSIDSSASSSSPTILDGESARLSSSGPFDAHPRYYRSRRVRARREFVHPLISHAALVLRRWKYSPVYYHTHTQGVCDQIVFFSYIRGSRGQNTPKSASFDIKSNRINSISIWGIQLLGFN